MAESDEIEQDDRESLDTFMLGVLVREHNEFHYGENRPNYLLALAWVLDNWRAEDDPVRRRLALIAEAFSTALSEHSGSCEVCGDTGYEWRDYWSEDATPCRNGCPVPAAESDSSGEVTDA